MLANNFTASASVNPIIKVSIFSLIAPSCNNPANVFAAFTSLAFSTSVPTIILDGYRLSYNAFDSRKNSGLKIILSQWNFSLMLAVYPTGIVDLITIIASGLYSITSLITASTADVSKKFFLLS